MVSSTPTPHESAMAVADRSVRFEEVTSASASRLWETERVRHADLNRLHLRSLEVILNPTCSANDIMSAVIYGVTSQGLRVTQRDEGRLVAQRIEAPYLANLSAGRRRTSPNAGKEEWRVVVATLGVSRDIAAWGGVERVLRLSFLTDPIPKQTDLAGRGAAAMASMFGSVASVAAGLGGASGSSRRDGPNGVTGSSSSSNSSSSLSAAAIANLRSTQRADALVKAVVAELDRLGHAADPDIALPGLHASSPSGIEVGGDACDAGTTGADAADAPVEELVLALFEGGEGKTGVGGVASALLVSVAGGQGVEGEVNGEGQSIQLAAGETTMRKDGDGLLLASAGASATAVVKVRLSLQFVEGLCARAEEYSRRDASETWKPLEETVLRLEADNAKLRSLLEPKYRALGVAPPRVPTWSGRRGFGNSSGPGLGSEALNVDGASRRVVTLFQSTPLFEIEGAWVKTSVTVAGSTHRGEKERGSNEALAAASSSLSNAMPPPQTSSLTELQASKTVGAWRHRLALRAAVKSLAEMVSGACEAREEELLKSRLPGVQAYISELEAYRSAIVRGKPLRAVTASCEGGDGVGVRQGSRHMVEIDDDLWRLFAVQETRLYSSPAALGSKPGRVYLTFNTLWFHSKVLGFEFRHVLPLVEVRSVTLLRAPLDLSSSLVISTKSGGEVMLVFPGKRMAALEPLEILIQQLAVVAAEEGDAGNA